MKILRSIIQIYIQILDLCSQILLNMLPIVSKILIGEFVCVFNCTNMSLDKQMYHNFLIKKTE